MARFEPPIDVRIAIVTSAHRRLSAVSQEFIEAFRAHVVAMVQPTRSGHRKASSSVGSR